MGLGAKRRGGERQRDRDRETETERETERDGERRRFRKKFTQIPQMCVADNICYWITSCIQT